jgi:hypothetical protein
LARLGRARGLAALAAGCAAAAGLLAACSSAAAGPAGPAGEAVRAGPAGATPNGPHLAVLDAGGNTHATLRVVTGTTTLTIQTADLGVGGSLLRVSTPAGGAAPLLRETEGDGAGAGPLVTLSAAGARSVTVTLNADVSWQLDLGGGSTRTNADLRGGQLTGIAFTAGSDVISLALPRPRGSVPVRLSGGAGQFLLSLPAGVPVRVTAGSGAGEVSVEGQEHAGVAGGSVFTAQGWTPGVAGFDVDATSGASSITVTARAA